MKAQSSKSVNSRHSRRWKPLSVEQENAIDRLILGDTDEEAGAAVGACRQTLWTWRNTHPVFKAELQQRRANLYGAACERLRSLVSKAVENIAGAIEEGNVPMSVELLKIIGVHGNGTMNAVHGLDPEQNFTELVSRRLADEKLPGHLDHRSSSLTITLAKRNGKPRSALSWRPNIWSPMRRHQHDPGSHSLMTSYVHDDRLNV
jgi:hypothetical protein